MRTAADIKVQTPKSRACSGFTVRAFRKSGRVFFTRRKSGAFGLAEGGFPGIDAAGEGGREVVLDAVEDGEPPAEDHRG